MTRKQRASKLFTLADTKDSIGDYRAAFRLMQRAATLGDVGAQVNVGNYYTDGKGVRRDLRKGLYWYLRAYRRGDSGAANNIGCTWRDEGQLSRALRWFAKAVAMGDEDANIEIGKHYLHNEKNPRKAIIYFNRVIKAKWVCEASVEQATELLRQAQRELG